MRKILTTTCLLVLSLGLAATARAGDAVENRVRKLEQESFQDRIDFTGDFRFEAHNLHYTFPDHFDGMALQNLMVNSLFAVGGGLVAMPSTPEQMASFVGDVQNAVAANYSDYLYFRDNLTWQGLQEMMAGFTPEQQAGLMQLLLPATARQGYDVANDVMYTSRLRLDLGAKVMKNVTFSGRLSMYKTWGDATGAQVFNGQSNSFIVDGNDSSVPNSDVVRVERAYFTWNELLLKELYLSIGRRPSTDGPPLNLRNDEVRAGSPMGTLIDMQFDGITLGYHLTDWSTARLCYGLGYESQYGNGVLSENPLKDAQFLGLNWDVYDKDDTFVQATVARGFNVTDGFNGVVVLPDNPVTGEPVGAPVLMRFTPSANLGDIDLAGVLLMRRDGPVDWFGSFSYMKSHPDDVTTPFGGLFSDPFQSPESQDATMVYVGARFNFNEDRTKVGVEYNHGSEYWFNFTPAQDDIVAPKTNTRGDVWEAYVTHRIGRRFIAKLGYQNYQYDYSGSGWHMGAPKKLDDMPVLGYPTYSEASALSLSLTARF